MTEDEKSKFRAWLQRRDSLEDLYTLASLLWDERLRRLRLEDKEIIPYDPASKYYQPRFNKKT
jgi:hypothetical protein